MGEVSGGTETKATRGRGIQGQYRRENTTFSFTLQLTSLKRQKEDAAFTKQEREDLKRNSQTTKRVFRKYKVTIKIL